MRANVVNDVSRLYQFAEEGGLRRLICAEEKAGTRGEQPAITFERAAEDW
jgi:hypothetical protein